MNNRPIKSLKPWYKCYFWYFYSKINFIGQSIFTIDGDYKSCDKNGPSYTNKSTKLKENFRMNLLFFIASTLLSVISVSANKVVHLNSDNFDMVVDGSRNVLVKFEASWCGPCKRIAPMLSMIAKEVFPNIDGDTVIAAIDADEEREIGDRFQIEAFPTIKLFLKGRSQEDAVDFTGERTPQNFVRFIKENIGANLATLPDEIRLAAPNVLMTEILAEIAKTGPKPLAKVELNFATPFFDEENFMPEKPQPKQQQKNLKTRKDKNRKNKQQHANKPQGSSDHFPLVSADQAQKIISNAGSRPVLLVFFSPSKRKRYTYSFILHIFILFRLPSLP